MTSERRATRVTYDTGSGDYVSRLEEENKRLLGKLAAIRRVLSGSVTTSADSLDEAILRILDEPSKGDG